LEKNRQFKSEKSEEEKPCEFKASRKQKVEKTPKGGGNDSFKKRESTRRGTFVTGNRTKKGLIMEQSEVVGPTGEGT